MPEWLIHNDRWLNLLGMAMGVIGLVYGYVQGARSRHIRNLQAILFMAFFRSPRRLCRQGQSAETNRMREQFLDTIYATLNPTEAIVQRWEVNDIIETADARYLRGLINANARSEV